MNNGFNLEQALLEWHEKRKDKSIDQNQDNGGSIRQNQESPLDVDSSIVIGVVNEIPHDLFVLEKKERFGNLLPYLVQFSRSDLDLVAPLIEEKLGIKKRLEVEKGEL